MSTLTIPIQHVLEALTRAISPEKERNGVYIEKKEVNLLLFTDDMTL